MGRSLAPIRYLYPYDPHTKTLRDIPTCDYNPMIGPRPPIPAKIYTFAIESKHPIVRRWSEVSKEIGQKLDAVGLRWCAIECLQRRQLEEPSQTHDDTSVVITLDELPEITDEITKIVHSIHKLSGDLFVEIVEGGVFRGCAVTTEAGQMDRGIPKGTLEVSARRIDCLDDLPGKPVEVYQKPPYDRQPEMGGSIGVSDNNWSAGSFGGYVELFKEGTVITCGLTCHHVLRPRKPTETSPDDDCTGLPPIEAKSRESIRICHPSLLDYEYTYNKDLQDALRHLNELRLLERTDQNTKAIQIVEERIVEMKKKKETRESTSRDIGSIFATSGLRVHQKNSCLLDWGLIELKPECIGVNIFGRLSLEYGTINSVKSRICFREGSRRTETEELMLISKYSEDPPSRYGDSGALVTSWMGQMIGLLWDLRIDKETGWKGGEVSYFTPIDPIIEDIQEVTEYQIRIGETSKGLSAEERTEYSLPRQLV